MPTIFTRIIRGELPAEVVYRDDSVIAFLPLEPIQPGHTLVVPLTEVDEWMDLDGETAAHLVSVCLVIGRALRRAFGRSRVAVAIIGFGVPHAHVHLVPIDDAQELRFEDGEGNAATPEELAEAANRIRAEL